MSDKIKQCEKDISRAIITLYNDEAFGGEFYAHLITQMHRIISDIVPTAGVMFNKYVTLAVNPDFFSDKFIQDVKDDLKTAKLRQAMIIAHEALHVAFEHIFRYKDYENKKLYNIAADLVVNSCLPEDYLPEAIHAKDYDIPKDQTLDWYYNNFPIEKYPYCLCSGGEGSGDPDSNNEGSGEDGNCPNCGKPKLKCSHDHWKDIQNDEYKSSIIKDMIKKAAQQSQGAGNLHASIQELIAIANKPAVLPWNTILNRFFARITVGGIKYTKRRFSKRFNVRPGIKLSPKKKMLVLTDVSGSISNEEYTKFFTEIFKIASKGQVTVVEWDVKICSIKTVDKYTPNLTRTGQGGTDPSEAIEFINENRNKYDGAIFFTDGYLFDHIKTKISIPNLWVITENGSDEYLKDQTVIRLIK